MDVKLSKLLKPTVILMLLLCIQLLKKLATSLYNMRTGN